MFPSYGLAPTFPNSRNRPHKKCKGNVMAGSHRITVKFSQNHAYKKKIFILNDLDLLSGPYRY